MFNTNTLKGFFFYELITFKLFPFTWYLFYKCKYLYFIFTNEKTTYSCIGKK